MEHWYEIIYLLIASRNKQKVHLELVTEPFIRTIKRFVHAKHMII